MNFATEAEKEHNNLKNYSDIRFSELIEIFSEENSIIVNYEKLLCRLTLILGQLKPKDTVDQTTRDLMADVFDFLFAARQLILQNNASAAFPLLRRAFESLSLINYFILKPSRAESWNRGKEIKNAEVRNFLGTHRTGLTAPEKAYKKDYADYSRGSHPNRNYVPYRFLGEPNEFVLGAFGKPQFLIVGDYLQRLIGLWFWFAAMLSVHNVKLIEFADPNYNYYYMQIAENAQRIVTRTLKDKCIHWSKQYDDLHQNDIDEIKKNKAL